MTSGKLSASIDYYASKESRYLVPKHNKTIPTDMGESADFRVLLTMNIKD
jgi:hypothetical protein